MSSLESVKIKLMNLNEEHLELEDTMHGVLICMAHAACKTKPAEIEEHVQHTINLMKEIDQVVHQKIEVVRELCQAKLAE